jgi:hypothetical protein
MGMEELSKQVLESTARAVEEFGEIYTAPVIPGLNTAFKLGEVGHDYYHECQHVQPRSKVNADTGIKALDFMAEKIAWGALNAE